MSTVNVAAVDNGGSPVNFPSGLSSSGSPIASKAELSANEVAKASALVTQPTEYANEQPTSVFSILRGRANVKRFWVSGDGGNWTNAINKMLASGARNLVLPGDVDYVSAGGHLILDDQDLYFDGVEIFLNDQTKRLFSSIAKSRWSIRGNVRAYGGLVTADTQVETGLYIEDGKRYVVEGFEGRNFRGSAIHLAGSNAGALRGDRGRFLSPAAFECTTGFKIDAGAGAEYNDWVAPHASGNTIGMLMAAGNQSVSGGAIVDNSTGVKLVNGPNHGHGSFVGTQINHNNAANLHAVGVLNGHSLTGCHFYGNGGTTGPIWFDGSKGILVTGGIIDCPIYNDTGAGSGANYVTNNYFPGDYGVTLLSNTGAAGLAQLYVSGNFAPTGPSAVNDPSPVFLQATRSGSTQDLSGLATTVVFNNEINDLRGAYDPATGIFTAPVTGTYVFEVAMTVTGTGLSNSFAEFVRNNETTVGYFTLSLNATLIEGGRTLTYPMTAGDTMRIKSTITGTSPVLALNTSSLTVVLS